MFPKFLLDNFRKKSFKCEQQQPKTLTGHKRKNVVLGNFYMATMDNSYMAQEKLHNRKNVVKQKRASSSMEKMANHRVASLFVFLEG